MTPDALPGLLLLFVAAAGWYVAVRAAADAGGGSATRLAGAFALPAALTAVLAGARGQTDAAVAVPIGCALAALTLVRGVTLTSGPVAQPRRTGGRRGGLVLLPVAAVLVVVGLRGPVEPWHASLLLATGLAAVWAWRAHQPAGHAEKPPKTPRIVLLAGAVVVSAAAAMAALAVVGAAVRRTGYATEALLSSLLLSAMLVLPTVGVVALRVRQNRAGQALAAVQGYALLMLGVALPLAMLTWHAGQFAQSLQPPAVADASQIAELAGVATLPRTLSIPLRVWRLDAMLLLLLGVLGLPAALGRWRPGRIEGYGLILLYAAYATAVALRARG